MIYPEADIYTLVVDTSSVSEVIKSHKIYPSFLQRIGGKKHYQKMLPLMPFALESFDLTDYDLIISSESGPAKGVIARPDAVHICYCHSPMRYVWDLYHQYLSNMNFVGRQAMKAFAPFLRQWDVTTAARVDHFIANSDYVAKRIEKYYRRSATVINPPVDLSRFRPSNRVEDYYLCAGQITPYKRIDIAVQAFTQMGKKLRIVGGGEIEKLKRMAGPTIEFEGQIEDTVMVNRMQACRALVFPGLEDFGIIPLEAMSCARPVIAYGKGGARETVIDGVTGILFEEQSVASLIDAVQRFEAFGVQASLDTYRKHVQNFSPDVFRDKIKAFVDQKRKVTG